MLALADASDADSNDLSDSLAQHHQDSRLLTANTADPMAFGLRHMQQTTCHGGARKLSEWHASMNDFTCAERVDSMVVLCMLLQISPLSAFISSLFQRVCRNHQPSLSKRSGTGPF